MEGKCKICPHDFAPHVLIPTKNDPMEGGILLCPEKGCDCFGTWDVPPFSTKEDVVIPTDDEIAKLREMFQE